MKTTYSVTGMTCGKCVAKVQKTLSSISGVEQVHVDLKSAQAEIVSSSAPALPLLNETLSGIGGYTLTPFQQVGMYDVLKKKIKIFMPLIVIFIVILSWTAIHQTIMGFDLHNSMHDFMAAFFFIFGGLKVLNWKNFAVGFAAYDPLAARSRFYAYAYPLIELFLGAAYQFRFMEELPVNIATVLILGISTYGIVDKLKKKELIQCACLGGFFNIPISYVTVFENVLMIVMAIYMQIVFGKI